MKRIIQWANFKDKDGALRSLPLTADGAAHLPDDADLISITPAYSIWLTDDGNIVDGMEDPAVKEGRKARAIALAAQGVPAQEISQRLGATVPMVNRWLTERDTTAK